MKQVPRWSKLEAVPPGTIAQKRLITSLSVLAIAAAVAVTACSPGPTAKDEDDNVSSGGQGGDGGDFAGGSGGDEGGRGGKGGSAGATGTAGSGGTAGAGGTGGSGGGAAGSAGVGGAGGVAQPYAFAHDFEQDTVGQAPAGMLRDENGKTRVDDTRAHSGSRSLKVHVESSDMHTAGMISVRSDQLLPKPVKTIYTRFMVWMDALPGKNGLGGGQGSHWDLVAHHGIIRGNGKTVSGFLSLGGFADDVHKLHLFGDDVSGMGRHDCTRVQPLAIPVREWACVELKVDEEEVFSYGVRINGKDLPGFSFMTDTGGSACVDAWNILDSKWYVPEVQLTRIGFRHWHPLPKPVTLWIDDIAIDNKPIGCPTKSP